MTDEVRRQAPVIEETVYVRAPWADEDDGATALYLWSDGLVTWRESRPETSR